MNLWAVSRDFTDGSGNTKSMFQQGKNKDEDSQDADGTLGLVGGDRHVYAADRSGRDQFTAIQRG
ncbi:MAG: hypothetical protein JW809_13985 [Pirellulales bacterium]|nr:hypothetical protein [Pirellulales bacterium]